MLPSYSPLGAALVLKVWLLPLCEGKSSSWLQPHHVRTESQAHFFPGWVGDLWVQTAASRGFFPSQATTQWTIKWSRVPGESGTLSRTLAAFRVHVQKCVPSCHLSTCSWQSCGNGCSHCCDDKASLSSTHTSALAAPKPNRESPHTALLIVLVAAVAECARHLACWANRMDNDSCLLLERSREKSHPLKRDQGDHRVCTGY